MFPMVSCANFLLKIFKEYSEKELSAVFLVFSLNILKTTGKFAQVHISATRFDAMETTLCLCTLLSCSIGLTATSISLRTDLA